MSAEYVGVVGIILLVILMFLRMRLGTVMILLGFLGYGYLAGWDKALIMIGLEPYAQTSFYQITALPLFILMGTMVAAAGISKDLYEAVRKWIGHIRGGMAAATAGACGLFAAICGDSIATAVTMGKIAYPEMKRFKYDDRLSTGVIAAGGTIGILIPPSTGFILYGILTEQSVGHLFIAGIIPGILQVIFYIITITIICRIKPEMGPPGPKVKFKDKVTGSKTVWPMVVIFILVMGGIYGGIFTPTEAGAVGAFGAIVLGFVMRRLNLPNIRAALTETASNTAMILFLLVGAYIFMRFTAVSNLPVFVSEFILNLELPRIIILIGILFVYIILGAFLDVLIVIILTTPIIFPTIVGLGYDPIWWGVMVVRIMEVGMITPPFGINLFVLAKTIKQPLGTVYRGVLPFVAADIVHIALLIAIPELALLLVHSMG
ncbi:MAG: TRAP transporter large permease [Peptococcaceae bacterium]|nr:TRAP transporter large permease [Peptococcaceae bacterium]